MTALKPEDGDYPGKIAAIYMASVPILLKQDVSSARGLRINWETLRISCRKFVGTAQRDERRAIGYAQHFSRSHNAVIRVYDAAGNVIETHEHAGDFKEGMNSGRAKSSEYLTNPGAFYAFL